MVCVPSCELRNIDLTKTEELSGANGAVFMQVCSAGYPIEKSSMESYYLCCLENLNRLPSARCISGIILNVYL